MQTVNNTVRRNVRACLQAMGYTHVYITQDGAVQARYNGQVCGLGYALPGLARQQICRYSVTSHTEGLWATTLDLPEAIAQFVYLAQDRYYGSVRLRDTLRGRLLARWRGGKLGVSPHLPKRWAQYLRRTLQGAYTVTLQRSPSAHTLRYPTLEAAMGCMLAAMRRDMPLVYVCGPRGGLLARADGDGTTISTRLPHQWASAVESQWQDTYYA